MSTFGNETAFGEPSVMQMVHYLALWASEEKAKFWKEYLRAMMPFNPSIPGRPITTDYVLWARDQPFWRDMVRDWVSYRRRVDGEAVARELDYESSGSN